MHLQAKDHQRLLESHQNLGRDKGVFYRFQRIAWPPGQYLNFRCLASRTVRKLIYVVQATQFVVLCYGSSRKRVHMLQRMGVILGEMVDQWRELEERRAGKASWEASRVIYMGRSKKVNSDR